MYRYLSGYHRKTRHVLYVFHAKSFLKAITKSETELDFGLLLSESRILTMNLPLLLEQANIRGGWGIVLFCNISDF